MLSQLTLAIRHRIAVKLTLTLVGFVAISVLGAGLYLNHALERLAVESLETRLATAGTLLADEARARVTSDASPQALREFVLRAAGPSGSRVTLIRTDGIVVADSDVPVAELPRLDSHAGRPEVRAALGGRRGRDLRRSATIDAPLLYVALPLRDGETVRGVLRLALPLSAVTSSYADVHHVMLLGAGVALAVALGIGLFVAGRVTRPVIEMQSIAGRMSEGDFTAHAPTGSFDEIGRLGRALNVMAARLRGKIDDLQQEQATISAVLDAMVEGVIAVDARDHIVLMNEPARALFDVGPGRGARKPLLEVVRNADIRLLLEDSRRPHPHAVTGRELQLPGAVERIVQANAVPLALGADETGVVMVLHDITELRRLETVRREFVANVSHELRTPLTAIHGYLETLIGGGLEEPEHARQFLEIVFRHTERLGRLLDDLTDLSNIELGRVRLRIEPVVVAEVVESVLAIMAPRASAGGVHLGADLPHGLPAVAADRDRLAQVLINLVDNAVKYTGEGGRVTVGARVVADAVEIDVADTGVGIPPADLARITERFYRVDKARSRELGGTGLGLAIVKHLVIAHGGDLRIESEPGRGTTMRVTLPMA